MHIFFSSPHAPFWVDAFGTVWKGRILKNGSPPILHLHHSDFSDLLLMLSVGPEIHGYGSFEMIVPHGSTQPSQSTQEIKSIAGLISSTTGVSVEHIQGSVRTRAATEARWLVAKMAHDLGYNYSEIGRFLKKHHTSVRHMVLNQ